MKLTLEEIIAMFKTACKKSVNVLNGIYINKCYIFVQNVDNNRFILYSEDEIVERRR